MTTACYWHLCYKEVSLFYVILISWGLAFMEYCLAVPANRYGSRVYNPAQLKIGRLNLAKATSSDSLSPSRVSR
jgi:uncharacterized protein (DUF486 family)